MSHDELVDQVADAIYYHHGNSRERARAAITVVLEAAAQAVTDCDLYDDDGRDWNSDPRATCAAAIRALGEKA